MLDVGNFLRLFYNLIKIDFLFLTLKKTFFKMPSHTYYTRSVAQRRKACRPPPLDLELINREKRKYSQKKNEINQFEQAIVGMPKFSCDAATSMSPPHSLHFTPTVTPSPKSNVEMSIKCGQEDNTTDTYTVVSKTTLSKDLKI